MKIPLFAKNLLIGTLWALPFAQAQTNTTFIHLTHGAPTVAHAVFARTIRGRMPVHSFTTLHNSAHRVRYFTELKYMTGQTVSHRWTYHGKVMALVPFHVDGPRWRVWSAKRLLPSQIGIWTAAVVDAQGHVLTQSSFTYVKAVNPTPSSSAAPAERSTPGCGA